jgi:hypothetical protein
MFHLFCLFRFKPSNSLISTIITCLTNIINHLSIHLFRSLRCKSFHLLNSVIITYLTNIIQDASIQLFCSLMQTFPPIHLNCHRTFNEYYKPFFCLLLLLTSMQMLSFTNLDDHHMYKEHY